MKRHENYLVCLFGVIILFFGIVIPFILRCFFSTGSNWLSFWGGYIGSLLATMATFIAFFITYKVNKKQNDTTQSEVKEMEIEIKKRDRMSCLPILTFMVKGTSDFKVYNYLEINLGEHGKGTYNTVWLKNIGNAAAIDVKFIYVKNYGKNKISKDIGHIEKDGFFEFHIEAPYESETHYPVILKFSDIRGNEYFQDCNMINRQYGLDKITFTATTYPKQAEQDKSLV